MKLIKIKDNVQNTAEAIASVIGVDVTVVDDNLVRIAGTGKYKNFIGEKVTAAGVFAYCLKEGTSYIIRNPKESYVCRMCEANGSCLEHAEIVCPIQVNNKVYGIIGLIAFNKEQKKLLLRNENSILDFLEKMSNLIAAKIVDQSKSQEIKILVSQLRRVINIIDKALIISDYDGEINYYNKKANELFDLNNCNIININDILDVEIQDLILKGEKIDSKEFEYKKNDCLIKGLITAEIFFDENEIKSVVYIIDELQSLISFARNILSPGIVTEFDNIIHTSLAMKNAIHLAKKASETDSTLLITGESGTGKELFARAIHNESNRCNEPFIAINCSAIPENLFESELFGYEEGAFTGALKGGHPGKFELANKGTLLLDEIGDMPIHLQPKLLRVLQDQKVMRIGGRNYISVDVRIMASTNANLEDKVKDREFREDLFYRLNVIPIAIPPLRNRLEDIEVLAQHFVQKYSLKLKKEVNNIDKGTMEYLKSYVWRGNVRELENSIEYAVNMTENKNITLNTLPQRIKKLSLSCMSNVNNDNDNDKICTFEESERQTLLCAIKKYGRDNEAVNIICELLGIGRATFYRKIKKYDI